MAFGSFEYAFRRLTSVTPGLDWPNVSFMRDFQGFGQVIYPGLDASDVTQPAWFKRSNVKHSSYSCSLQEELTNLGSLG